MAKIEIQTFFYDLIHCKNKINSTFEKWDKKYEEDERGPLVAGMRECPDAELITLLINIQKLAAGYEQIKELMDKAEQEQVDDLEPHYIWTTAYAQSKLHWKPMLPMSVLLLRVYKLEQPVTVPYLPEYGGCTSWVEVLSDVALGEMEPVLDDAEFQRRVDGIKGSLGLTVTAG